MQQQTEYHGEVDQPIYSHGGTPPFVPVAAHGNGSGVQAAMPGPQYVAVAAGLLVLGLALGFLLGRTTAGDNETAAEETDSESSDSPPEGAVVDSGQVNGSPGVGQPTVNAQALPTVTTTAIVTATPFTQPSTTLPSTTTEPPLFAAVFGSGANQEWHGTFSPRGRRQQPILISFENIRNSGFTGRVFWPGNGDTLTNMTGRVITDTADYADRGNQWKRVGTYDKNQAGVCVSFTETDVISGNNATTNNLYLACLSPSGQGTIEGKFFKMPGDNRPSGSFTVSVANGG